VYKELNLKEKLEVMSDTEKIKLLSTDGMLVKRPLVIGSNDKILVGFKENEWEVLK
jgi:arsenate reductase